MKLVWEFNPEIEFYTLDKVMKIVIHYKQIKLCILVSRVH